MHEREGNRLKATEIDVGIIGGGVIGLSIARKLAMEGREVVLFEAEKRIGTQTSSRNSEVIHSGLYYQPDSLKAILSVRGNKALYEYCQASEVKHEQTGKIIVATQEDDIQRLEALKENGERNGVYGLTLLDPKQVRDLEPQIKCIKGLYSPTTGVLEAHGLMVALRSDAERNGALVRVLSPVLEGEVQDNGIALVIGDNENINENTIVLCKTVINSAGLHAQDVAHKIKGLPKETIPPSFYAKGHYFILKKGTPFSHHIYPVPVPGGLGIHATKDVDGTVKFGPDVLWIEDKADYSFDTDRAGDFYKAIRRYYPDLQDGDLVPGYTGIRPKLGPPGSPDKDFFIKGPGDHGFPIVNICGIESPGLTASIPMAELIYEMLKK